MMKRFWTYLVLIIILVGCEKESTSYKKIHLEVDVKSSSPNGVWDNVAFEIYDMNWSSLMMVDVRGDQAPVKFISPEFTMPVGSNLRYNAYIFGFPASGLVGGGYNAWSDVTYKLYIGNKLVYKKTYSKGDANCQDVGIIVVE